MNSYKNPNAHWFGSPNLTAGRDGHDMAIQPAFVVLHTMVGTVASANARFQQASEQASATYGVGLDGSLYQWVDEADAAWANGTFSDNPGSNLDSISIEHEDNGDYNGPRTPQLYAASAALVRDVCTRYGIPIDRQHVLGHRECNHASTACPDALDVDRIVATAAAQGDNDLTPEQDQMLRDVHNILFANDSAKDPAGQPMNDHWAVGYTWSDVHDHIVPAVQQILTAVTAGSAVQVDAGAVATALGENAAFLQAVAAAVVKLEGAKLS